MARLQQNRSSRYACTPPVLDILQGLAQVRPSSLDSVNIVSPNPCASRVPGTERRVVASSLPLRNRMDETSPCLESHGTCPIEQVHSTAPFRERHNSKSGPVLFPDIWRA